MSPETVDRIEQALAPLAEAAGRGATQAWEVLVRQAVVTGAAYLIAGLAVGGMFVVAAVIFRAQYKRWRTADGWREQELAAVAGCASGFAAALTGVATAGCLSEGALRLLNPAYYALRDIASVVGA